MAVYIKDNPDFFAQAIQSIVDQTLAPDELVIVQDGPITDAQKKVLDTYMKEYPFIKTIQTKQNQGLGLALKLGVENCQCDLIARMDSDDIACPTRFEQQLSFLESHPEIRFVGSNTIEFIDSIDNVVSKRKMPETNEEIREYSRTRNPFIAPSTMFYRADVLTVGNYQSWHLCEDYELWSRFIMADIPCYNIQDNLVFMRTSLDFYKRRGGWKYCKSILKLKHHFRRIGFMSFGQFLKSSIASLVVSLSPNFIRKLIYTKFLRD